MLTRTVYNDPTSFKYHETVRELFIEPLKGNYFDNGWLHISLRWIVAVVFVILVETIAFRQLVVACVTLGWLDLDLGDASRLA